MLRLLEEEQKQENQREDRYRKAGNEEKQKLDREYGAERAKAQTRIQKLSEYISFII